MLVRLSLLALTAFVTANDVQAFKPRRDVDLRLRFENLDEFPEFDFYLKYEVPRENDKRQTRLAPLISGEYIPLKAPSAAGLSKVLVLAVPRGQKVHAPIEMPVDEGWLRDVPAGSLQSLPLRAAPDGDLLPGWPTVLVAITYRLRVSGQKLEVICTESRNLAEGWWESWVLFALVAVIGVVVVIVTFRHFKKPKRLHPAN